MTSSSCKEKYMLLDHTSNHLKHIAKQSNNPRSGTVPSPGSRDSPTDIEQACKRYRGELYIQRLLCEFAAAGSVLARIHNYRTSTEHQQKKLSTPLLGNFKSKQILHLARVRSAGKLAAFGAVSYEVTRTPRHDIYHFDSPFDNLDSIPESFGLWHLP